MAQYAAQSLRKGSKVYVEGSLRTRKWQDQQGNERYTTEIMATEFQALDSRQDASAGGFQPAGQFQPAPQAAQAAPQPSSQQPQSAPAPSGGFDDFDEDIPF